MALATDLIAQGVIVNMGKVLSRALVHDIDESYSGDFIRMFKHSSPSLKLAIENACTGFVRKFQEALAPGQYDIVMNWAEAKAVDIEGAIVGVSDFMSVVSYISQEVVSGNHSMLEHLKDLRQFYEGFWKFEQDTYRVKEKYTHLQEYLKECGRIIDEIDVKSIELK